MTQALQIMTTYSLVRQQEKNYTITTISTPNHHKQHIATTSSSILNLNAPTILFPVDKEYMCFQKDGKNAQSARCIKSRIMTKVIDSVISIHTFEQQFFVIRGILQLPLLKDHVQNIGIDQSLSNNDLY